VEVDENQSLRNLVELLNRSVAPWVALIESRDAWQIQKGSPLVEDDDQTAPYQLSLSVWHALDVGVDHLRCLQSSLMVQIHTHSQFSLVRAGIENGARAVWMVGPANRLTRVAHRLALEAMELGPAYRLWELVGTPPPRTKEERYKQLRSMAITAGVPKADVKEALRPAGYSAIVREAGELILPGPRGADAAEAAWRGCSALAHGDTSGTLGLLDREVVATSDGVNTTRVTASIRMLYEFASIAVLMIDRGFTLFQQQATP
jgi:hypothetical protein